MAIHVVAVIRVGVVLQSVVNVVTKAVVIGRDTDFILLRMPDPVQVEGVRGFDIKIGVIQLKCKSRVMVAVPE